MKVLHEIRPVFFLLILMNFRVGAWIIPTRMIRIALTSAILASKIKPELSFQYCIEFTASGYAAILFGCTIYTCPYMLIGQSNTPFCLLRRKLEKNCVQTYGHKCPQIGVTNLKPFSIFALKKLISTIILRFYTRRLSYFGSFVLFKYH